jgi:hypothetical protein
MRRQVLEALLARPELLAAPCRAEPQQLHALAEAIAAATPVVLGVSAGDLRDLRVDEQRLPRRLEPLVYPLVERLPMDGLPTHLPAAAIGVATGAPLLGTGAPLPVHPAAHWAIAAAAVRQPSFGESPPDVSPPDGPPPDFPDVQRAAANQAALVQPEASMTHGRLEYTRIWLQRAPEAGREGGGLEVDVLAIQRLAASATSIHIRLSGQPHHSVTLRQGVEWPLERLRRGLPFDVTDSGGDVTPELAAQTWSGEHVKAMVSRGHGDGPDRTLWEGVLYDARHNAEGLHLIEGSACELHRGRPAAVEVWLGGSRAADATL